METAFFNWFTHAKKLTPIGMCLKRNSGQSPTIPQLFLLGIPKTHYCPSLRLVKMIYISLLYHWIDASVLQTSVSYRAESLLLYTHSAKL